MNAKPSGTPRWRLPRGTTRGAWEYACDEAVAEGYDADLEGSFLFEFDEQFVRKHVRSGDTLVDLGSGTGRLLLPLAEAGVRCVAVDLSEPMLRVVQRKAEAANAFIDRLRTNIVELDGLRNGIADCAICMFSTLGMIRGAENRRLAVQHAHRILKPGGKFIVHVHNLWHNLFDPQPWWLARSLFRSAFHGDEDFGDKTYDYRGVPNFFLHAFRRREILGLLRSAGFRISEVCPLDTARRRALAFPWLLQNLRANGWIIVGEKS